MGIFGFPTKEFSDALTIELIHNDGSDDSALSGSNPQNSQRRHEVGVGVCVQGRCYREADFQPSYCSIFQNI